MRREERRRKEREAKKSKVTENVAEQYDSQNSDPETPVIFSCNHCEVHFKTEKWLNIHIGKLHKEYVLESTPEKQHLEVQDESSLLLTPIKEVREEPLTEDVKTSQLVCKKCGDLWGPLTSASYPTATHVDKVRWNTLCSSCWKFSMPCNVDYRFQKFKCTICSFGEESR